MRALTVAAAIAFALTCASASAGERFTGKVVAVHDGDTITVLRADHTTTKVRLAEVDAPECGQPYSRKSKKALSDLVFGRQVTIVADGKSYGRTVGWVVVDGADSDVDGAMVSQGAAWVYAKYMKRAQLAELQSEAQRAGKGLWALPAGQRTPPWDWRHSGHAIVNCE